MSAPFSPSPSASSEVHSPSESNPYGHEQSPRSDVGSGTAVAKRPIESSWRSAGLFRNVRRMVSGARHRLEESVDGVTFDLDFTFIADGVAAMGFPGDGIESLFRNDGDEVATWLEAKHSGCYRIWNLSQKLYDYEKFGGMVIEAGWPDHHAPPFNLLNRIVNSMVAFSLQDPGRNINIVHCKAGKGRTGTVVAAVLMYLGLFHTCADALSAFLLRRGEGLTSPSQYHSIRMWFALLLERNPTLAKHAYSHPEATHIGPPCEPPLTSPATLITVYPPPKRLGQEPQTVDGHSPWVGEACGGASCASCAELLGVMSTAPDWVVGGGVLSPAVADGDGGDERWEEDSGCVREGEGGGDGGRGGGRGAELAMQSAFFSSEVSALSPGGRSGGALTPGSVAGGGGGPFSSPGGSPSRSGGSGGQGALLTAAAAHSPLAHRPAGPSLLCGRVRSRPPIIPPRAASGKAKLPREYIQPHIPVLPQHWAAAATRIPVPHIPDAPLRLLGIRVVGLPPQYVAPYFHVSFHGLTAFEVPEGMVASKGVRPSDSMTSSAPSFVAPPVDPTSCTSHTVTLVSRRFSVDLVPLNLRWLAPCTPEMIFSGDVMMTFEGQVGLSRAVVRRWQFHSWFLNNGRDPYARVDEQKGRVTYTVPLRGMDCNKAIAKKMVPENDVGDAVVCVLFERVTDGSV